MGVKRFDFCEDEHSREGWMEEASLGQYVLASDYDARAALDAIHTLDAVTAQARVRELEAAMRNLVRQWDAWSAGDEPLGDERLEVLVEAARPLLTSLETEADDKT